MGGRGQELDGAKGDGELPGAQRRPQLTSPEGLEPQGPFGIAPGWAEKAGPSSISKIISYLVCGLFWGETLGKKGHCN